MATAKDEAVETLGQLSEERFKLELRKKALVQKFKDDEAALKKAHEDGLADVQSAIDEVDREIYRVANENRSVLIAAGRKSFAILSAKFQFQEVPEALKVLDAKSIMDVARRLGITKLVADPPSRKWVFNRKKFLKWFETNAKLRGHFASLVEVTDKSESLHMKPNASYVVVHDGKRLSPPSITIRKS